MNTLINPIGQANLQAYYRFDNNYENIQGNSTFDGIPVGSPAFDLPPPVFVPFTIVSILGTDLSCFESGDGEINIVTTGNNVEYSIDGINNFDQYKKKNSDPLMHIEYFSEIQLRNSSMYLSLQAEMKPPFNAIN